MELETQLTKSSDYKMGSKGSIFFHVIGATDPS